MSIFLLAVAAILALAVSVEAEGFDINIIGVILMVVSGIGILRVKWGRSGHLVRSTRS